MNSDIQVSLTYYSRAYVYLKDYPNRPLLARSKIITFSNNQNLFEQRCSLFVDICCMLFKLQMQKNDVYVSKNIFIDYNHLIFMLYSFDKTHQGKLKKVKSGNLMTNIIDFYGIIFVRQAIKINDYEHNFIFQNIRGIINHLFELKDKSQQGYFQQSQGNTSIENQQILMNNPSSIMKKLANSHIFSQYFYLMKVNKAIIINVLIDPSIMDSNQLQNTYVQIVYLQRNLFKLIKKSDFVEDVKDLLYSFQEQFINLLTLLQLHNYINLMKVEQENRLTNTNKYNVLDIQFRSNLRKLSSCAKTAEQKSTQSSVCEDNTEGSKEQKKRQKDLFQSIKKFENQINFRIEVTYHLQKKYFVVEVQGLTDWCLDESLYSHLFDMWTEFNNSWHNELMTSKQEIPQSIKPFKLQMLQRNKNVIIREMFKNNQICNLTLQILALVDKISMFFLLFQKVFKHLYKITHNIMLCNEQYFKNIKNREYISNVIRLHKNALQMYSQVYNQLTSQERKLYYDFN